MMDSKAALKALMSEISEDRYCADWRHELEFELWNEVRQLDSSVPAGLTQAKVMPEWSSQTIQRLQQLAAQASGWFWWPIGSLDAQFIPMNEWLPKYAVWSGHHQKEDG